MPRTEREVDVWRNWTTGELRSRVIEEAPFGRSFTPTYDEVMNHIYQPWRYKFSMDNGRVPEHAYINIENYKTTRGHPTHLLEWFDESHFNGDVARHPSYYLEVPKLDVDINTHSKAPAHLSFPTTHIQPNFHRSAPIQRDIDAFSKRVEQFCLFITEVRGDRNGMQRQAQVKNGLHALHEWLSSSSLSFLLHGTLAYLEECSAKPFHDVLNHFEDQIQTHMHADLGAHWSRHAQEFDAHTLEEENLIRSRDEAHVISKAIAFIKRIQYLVNRLVPVPFDTKGHPKNQKTISEAEVEIEVSKLILMAKKNRGTGLHFPSTFDGLCALSDFLRAYSNPPPLVEVKHKFDELVRDAFVHESREFNSRLPRALKIQV
jgi:hypothetical protein